MESEHCVPFTKSTLHQRNKEGSDFWVKTVMIAFLKISSNYAMTYFCRGSHHGSQIGQSRNSVKFASPTHHRYSAASDNLGKENKTKSLSSSITAMRWWCDHIQRWCSYSFEAKFKNAPCLHSERAKLCTLQSHRCHRLQNQWIQRFAILANFSLANPWFVDFHCNSVIGGASRFGNFVIGGNLVQSTWDWESVQGQTISLAPKSKTTPKPEGWKDDLSHIIANNIISDNSVRN